MAKQNTGGERQALAKQKENELFDGSRSFMNEILKANNERGMVPSETNPSVSRRVADTGPAMTAGCSDMGGGQSWLSESRLMKDELFEARRSEKEQDEIIRQLREEVAASMRAKTKEEPPVKRKPGGRSVSRPPLGNEEAINLIDEDEVALARVVAEAKRRSFENPRKEQDHLLSRGRSDSGGVGSSRGGNLPRKAMTLVRPGKLKEHRKSDEQDRPPLVLTEGPRYVEDLVGGRVPFAGGRKSCRRGGQRQCDLGLGSWRRVASSSHSQGSQS